MGFQKEQRNTYTKGGMQVAGNSTFQGDVNVEGTFTETAGRAMATQTLTSSSGTTNGFGATFVSSTAAGIYHQTIGTPVAGYEHHLASLVQSGSSSTYKFRTTDTGVAIASTAGRVHSVILSTGGAATLLGVSSTQWMLVNHINASLTTSAAAT